MGVDEKNEEGCVDVCEEVDLWLEEDELGEEGSEEEDEVEGEEVCFWKEMEEVEGRIEDWV